MVAADVLATDDVDMLALTGAGTPAVEHAIAIGRVRDQRRIDVWSRSEATPDSFARKQAPRWPHDLGHLPPPAMTGDVFLWGARSRAWVADQR